MELPKKWPGRTVVRQTLTIMRLSGHWDSWVSVYAVSSRRVQKIGYTMFRLKYYLEMRRIDPDRIRIGR